MDTRSTIEKKLVNSEQLSGSKAPKASTTHRIRLKQDPLLVPNRSTSDSSQHVFKKSRMPTYSTVKMHTVTVSTLSNLISKPFRLQKRQ